MLSAASCISNAVEDGEEKDVSTVKALDDTTFEVCKYFGALLFKPLTQRSKSRGMAELDPMESPDALSVMTLRGEVWDL